MFVGPVEDRRRKLDGDIEFICETSFCGAAQAKRPAPLRECFPGRISANNISEVCE